MSKVKTTPWDAAEHIKTKEDVIAYLEAALEENDPALMKVVLSDIARSEGIKQVGLGSTFEKENIYEVLTGQDNMDFTVIMKLLQALGLRLSTVAA